LRDKACGARKDKKDYSGKFWKLHEARFYIVSIDAVNLPGFQFIQDPLDYDTRTHHSNMDTYELIQEPDMKQMAVIVASFVYLTANRDEMVPRKPLQKTRPKTHQPVLSASVNESYWKPARSPWLGCSMTRLRQNPKTLAPRIAVIGWS